MTTPLRQLGAINREMERHGRVGEFFKGIRYLMLDPQGGADHVAEKARAPDRVVDFVKAAITPGTTLTGQWGVELATIENLPQAFLSSLQGTSVFDTLLRCAHGWSAKEKHFNSFASAFSFVVSMQARQALATSGLLPRQLNAMDGFASAITSHLLVAGAGARLISRRFTSPLVWCFADECLRWLGLRGSPARTARRG